MSLVYMLSIRKLYYTEKKHKDVHYLTNLERVIWSLFFHTFSLILYDSWHYRNGKYSMFLCIPIHAQTQTGSEESIYPQISIAV